MQMAENDQPEKIQGTCLCGEVAFEAEPPAKFCAHCHCTYCRRAHGAAFVTWAGFLEAQVRIVKGEELLTRFKATPQATRTFCRACGTQLFFQGERWPGEIHVARATLADDAPLVPDPHVYFADRAPWLAMHDDLPKRGSTTDPESQEEQ